MFRSSVIAVVLFFLAAAALACPLCSEAMNDGKGPNQLAKGMAWSIYFMLLIPFSLMALGIGLLVRSIRRQQQRARESGLPQIVTEGSPELPVS